MLETYLDDESDVLDGFGLPTMAEAGEAGHWEALQETARSASQVQEPVQWALPIRQRRFDRARETSAKLAAEEDPNEAS